LAKGKAVAFGAENEKAAQPENGRAALKNYFINNI
jgi:hypothetical protein